MQNIFPIPIILSDNYFSVTMDSVCTFKIYNPNEYISYKVVWKGDDPGPIGCKLSFYGQDNEETSKDYKVCVEAEEFYFQSSGIRLQYMTGVFSYNVDKVSDCIERLWVTYIHVYIHVPSYIGQDVGAFSVIYGHCCCKGISVWQIENALIIQCILYPLYQWNRSTVNDILHFIFHIILCSIWDIVTFH